MRIAFTVKFRRWKRDYCGDHNKIHKCDEIPMEKRQIFNTVEYSEARVESLVLGREIEGAN